VELNFTYIMNKCVDDTHPFPYENTPLTKARPHRHKQVFYQDVQVFLLCINTLWQIFV